MACYANNATLASLAAILEAPSGGLEVRCSSCWSAASCVLGS